MNTTNETDVTKPIREPGKMIRLHPDDPGFAGVDQPYKWLLNASEIRALYNGRRYDA